jgi:hypothetical protein
MNPETPHERLLEIAWRRGLTDAESAELRAWLAAHPDASSDWREELELSRALGGLKDAPLASNFTARVVAAATRETAPSRLARGPVWRDWWSALGWLPKTAVTTAAVALCLLSIHRYQEARSWNRLVSSVESFSKAKAAVAAMPSAEALQDFDVIRKLDSVPPDRELLTLFK